MQIKINNAFENNLKNISVAIPLHKITGITGVSGSGKSTLLKNIIAAYGSRNYTLISSKTVKNALNISDYIKVDDVLNLPQTIFIDAKNSIKNPTSTVSTVTGIHEIFRNLFTEYGASNCLHCGNRIDKHILNGLTYIADVVCDKNYEHAVDFLSKAGRIDKTVFFDKNRNISRTNRARYYASIYFTIDENIEIVIKEFNKQFNCRIIAVFNNEQFDPLKESVCSNCGCVWPRLIRSRISFNTGFDAGGGACRLCSGKGCEVSINEQFLINDPRKSIAKGGVNFITNKGIKYTSFKEGYLKSALKHFKIDEKTAIKEMSQEQKKILFYGSNEMISINIRAGEKKEFKFEGLANYLKDSYIKGKGLAELSELFYEQKCSACNGTRIDKDTNSFRLFGTTIQELLAMSLTELGEWCGNNKKSCPQAGKYLERLKSKIDVFNLVACGHLTLDRSSSTLSGGELQRLRLCSMFNADVSEMCYLLDEPSSGMHFSDIEMLGDILRKMCSQGNTIIMVEHNPKMLSYCSNIVDMGPVGGDKGGQVLLCDSVNNINKYDTPTAQLLRNEIVAQDVLPAKSGCKMLEFNNLSCNNLKSVNVRFPRNSFTTVCGVSGSGKSTFIKQVLLKRIGNAPVDYGFEKVVYIGQEDINISSLITVSTQLKVTEHIAKLYSKQSRLKKQAFMMNSGEGKCIVCGGKGVVVSEANEIIGLCNSCMGKRFSDEVLKTKLNGIDIHQFFHMPLSELGKVFGDERLKSLSMICQTLGIGYLTLSRSLKTLSKGEIQRLRLANALYESQKNTLFLLDEPSKGLHSKDVGKLVQTLRQLTELNNTIVSVEHNPLVIRNSDYIIEFGGTGKDGGYLLYSGNADKIDTSTPTGRMISETVTFREHIDYKTDCDNIHIWDNDRSFRFRQHKVNKVKNCSSLISLAADKVKKNFLSVAIPNNIFYSKIGENNVNVYSPMVCYIDFNETIKYDISLYSALNIKQHIIASAEQEFFDQIGILRYLLDDLSPTGKCRKCGGSGLVFWVPEDFFVEDNELSNDCIKFLNKCTDYKEVQKALKIENDLDIGQSLRSMNEKEKEILFAGYDKPLSFKGKSVIWKGIIEYFLQLHKYYTGENSRKALAKKMNIICPHCKGKIIDDKYNDYRIWGLNYCDIVSKSIDDLYTYLKAYSATSNELKKIMDIMELMVKVGLGALCFKDKLSSLDNISAQLVNFISKCANNIWGMVFVIKNSELLSKELWGIIYDIIIGLTNNTVIVLE